MAIKRYEERRKRFEKVFPYRINKTLDSLRSLGKCANRYNYAYEIKEVRETIQKVRNELERVEHLFYLGYSKKEKDEEVKENVKKRKK